MVGRWLFLAKKKKFFFLFCEVEGGDQTYEFEN